MYRRYALIRTTCKSERNRPLYRLRYTKDAAQIPSPTWSPTQSPGQKTQSETKKGTQKGGSSNWSRTQKAQTNPGSTTRSQEKETYSTQKEIEDFKKLNDSVVDCIIYKREKKFCTCTCKAYYSE